MNGTDLWFEPNPITLNGLAAEKIEFDARDARNNIQKIIGHPIRNEESKTKNIDSKDVLGYFAMFVRDYNPAGSESYYHKEITTSASGSCDYYTVDVFTPAQDVSSKYNDVTQNIRIINDNLKICPNNSEEGTWKNNESNPAITKSLFWVADEPLYLIVFQNEGFIDHNLFIVLAGDNDGVSPELLIAWNRNIGIVDYNQRMIIDGMLTFPYGPAIITIPDGTSGDEFGPFFRDAYEVDDGTDSGYNKERYYSKFGKILGNMTEGTIGMVSINSPGQIIPADINTDSDNDSE